MNDQFSQASQILDVLREIELVVAELYRRFSVSFPHDRVFWQDLSDEEENHAASVAELKNTLLKNGAPFEIGKINLFVLTTYRQGIESIISRLQRGSIGRRDAFFIARDLERSLIERSFYNTIRSENKAYQLIQQKIQKETESHFQKLENYIQTIFP
jgi:uncharacterized protein (DUF1919 family)